MGIPAGYQVHIKTWENDGDCYKTQVVSGLTEKEDVFFLIALAKKFESMNALKPGLGNGCVHPAELVAVISELKREHGVSWKIRDLFPDVGDQEYLESEEDLQDWYTDSLMDNVLGITEQYYWDFDGEGTGPFCRVFESFKVYYHPGEVEDVTTQFK